MSLTLHSHPSKVICSLLNHTLTSGSLITSALISTATPDGGAAHSGERLPRQPHTRGDGGAAGDAREEDGAEWRVQRQLDRPH